MFTDLVRRTWPHSLRTTTKSKKTNFLRRQCCVEGIDAGINCFDSPKISPVSRPKQNKERKTSKTDVKITRSQRLLNTLGIIAVKTLRHLCLSLSHTHTHVTEMRPSGVVSDGREPEHRSLRKPLPAPGRPGKCNGTAARAVWEVRVSKRKRTPEMRVSTHAQH